MDNFILVGSEDSENSIIEVAVPKRATPPLIEIDDDDILLNLSDISDGSLEIDSDPPEVSDIQIIEELHHEQNVYDSQFNSPNHWTEDMIKFYNDDWGNEKHFSVEKIQRGMDKSPALWQISHRDFIGQNRTRKKQIYCRNCFQPGHIMAKCPDPLYIPKCHMCGTSGHKNRQCPNAICLNCGNQTREYMLCCNKCKYQAARICSRCSIRGHDFINCPDHWRLFHLTTKSREVVVPCLAIHKDEKDMWCCNCGRKGHFQNNCTIKKDMRGFTDTVPFVVSYEKDFLSQNSKEIRKSKKKKNYRYSSKISSKDKKQRQKGSPVLEINPISKIINKAKLKNKQRLRKKKRKGKNQVTFTYPT